MKTIYTVILISGLYTDGYVKRSTPIPVSQIDCVAIAQTTLDNAKCVQLPWPADATALAAAPTDAQ